MDKIKKFKIYTLGCKVNQYDSRDLAKEMVEFGFCPASKNADIAIINTCSVTKTAIQKGRRAIIKAKKENPGAKIIFAGCFARVYPNEAKKEKVNLVFKEYELKSLAKKISADSLADRIVKEKIKNNFKKTNNRSRYFIKIQDGCNQFCSYCIIPYARGKSRSRKEEEILEEIRTAVKSGYREIVLCGIHLGIYGQDIKIKKGGQKIDLAGLLKKIIKIKELGRVRLSSIEPNEINKDIINLIASSKKICKHLHIPLQSGSDRILKLMNRPYSTKDFCEKIKEIRAKISDIAITSDIIVGFPGEEEKNFKDTIKFVREMKFSRIHVFPFSPHEKTPAGKMEGQIPRAEILRRAKILREIGEELAISYQSKFAGKKLEISVEKIGKEKICGKTEYYFDICSQIKKGEKKIIPGEIMEVLYK